MVTLLTTGPPYFPGWLGILFPLGLAWGIVHHAPRLLRYRGSRWFHLGHVAMAVLMIHMLCGMELLGVMAGAM